jgi:hypothetical protein
MGSSSVFCLIRNYHADYDMKSDALFTHCVLFGKKCKEFGKPREGSAPAHA